MCVCVFVCVLSITTDYKDSFCLSMKLFLFPSFFVFSLNKDAIINKID